MKHKKMLIAGLCIILVSALMITGSAVTKYKFTSSSGETVSKYINRVNINVSATEFVFRRADENGMLECRTTVSVEKTEPDFYGKLHSITIGGTETGMVMYTAGKDNGDAVLPEEVVLPADEDGTLPLTWEIAFSIPYEEGKTEYEATIDFNYTTGVKTNLTQRYMTSIPVTVTVK